MKGYHYTPITNLEAIRKNGLEPSLVKPDKIRCLLDYGIPAEALKGLKCVWTWYQQLQDTSHAGEVIYIAGRHGCPPRSLSLSTSTM